MDIIYCAFCSKEISPDILAKRHYSSNKWPKYIFHTREEVVAFRKQHNDYSCVSKLAMNRSAAVAQSNREHPRRAKK